MTNFGLGLQDWIVFFLVSLAFVFLFLHPMLGRIRIVLAEHFLRSGKVSLAMKIRYWGVKRLQKKGYQ